MIREALHRNPNKWPVPIEVCQRVAEEILEARGDGMDVAIDIALKHGVLSSPMEVRAERTIRELFGEKCIFTGIEDRYERIPEGFESMVATDTNLNHSADSCFVMVGIHAHKELEGRVVPVGVRTDNSANLIFIHLDDRRDFRNSRDSYGFVERLVHLQAGQSAQIYLPQAPFPNL